MNLTDVSTYSRSVEDMISGDQNVWTKQNMIREYGGVPVILHADDYGETNNSCVEMLELLKGGYLDGISLITNMRDYERYVQMFYKAIPDMPKLPLINIHINLVEGRSLPDSDGEGNYGSGECLKWTWAGLYKTSYHLPSTDNSGNAMKYREVYGQLVREIKQQLKRGREFTEKALGIARENGIPYAQSAIRIDSHQHAHMIPIVWKAITDVISGEGLEVEYIRNSHEPVIPFLKHKKCRNMIGFIKNRVLAVCAPRVENYIRANIGTPSYLCGVMMSGHMDAVRLMMVLPGILDICRKKKYGLEINIHPSMMLETEMTEEIPADAAGSFYMSADRHMEALTVRTIRAALEEYYSRNNDAL